MLDLGRFLMFVQAIIYPGVEISYKNQAVVSVLSERNNQTGVNEIAQYLSPGHFYCDSSTVTV